MPYIPHSSKDVEQMLDTIGISAVDDLFDEIPKEIQAQGLDKVPTALTEMSLGKLMSQKARMDEDYLCFMGAGCYEHHIPAAVWDIAMRGEYLTAYTPYQAEASQGTLQLIYEFQSNIVNLTGLDAANASLYDGASGVAEAILMAVRANRKAKSRRVLVAGTLHPRYRQVVHSIVESQNIEIVEVDYNHGNGIMDLAGFVAHESEPFAAIVVQHPNFFGNLEMVDQLTNWAHAHGGLMIAVANPLSLGLMKPVSEWGETGADIVVGEGQPLGIPMASGGPHYGYMACTQALVRQMPGRIIGKTIDLNGNVGYTLTLQAREQHIRRAKATSNICTNQGLAVTASTVHIAILGFEGLARVATTCVKNTQRLLTSLTEIDGINEGFTGPRFHEAVIRFANVDAQQVLQAMADKGVLAGFYLGSYYPELADAILICATEMRTDEDIDQYKATLLEVLSELSGEVA